MDIGLLLQLCPTLAVNIRYLGCLFVIEVPATAGGTSNSVAFFIDAVQDFYLGDVIRAMVGVFTAANASITLGIAGNKIGTDATIMTTLTEVLRSSQFKFPPTYFHRKRYRNSMQWIRL